VWHLADRTVLSDRLVELVQARLGQLDKTEWRLLELVAFGEPIAMDDLARLADPDVANRLEEKGLLASAKVSGTVELRLAHPLYGDVVRERTSALRVPTIAKVLAEAIEARRDLDAEDALRVATLRLECGGAPAERMLEAAKTARRRYDFALAERLCQAALQAGGGFEAELLAAQLACLLGREREAEARLVDLGTRALTDSQRGRVIVSQLDTIGFYEGRVIEGTAIADHAAVTIHDESWRDEIEGRKAAFVLATDGPTAALAISAPLMDRGAQGRARVWSCIITAWTLGRQGRISEALAVADDGYATHIKLSDDRLDWYPWVHLFLRCEALANAGRFDEAHRAAAEQYQLGLAMKSAEAQAFFSWHLAMTVGEQGSTVLALQHAREAINQFRGLGRPQYVRELLIALSLSAALQGDTATARSALESLEVLELDSPPWKTTELYVARSWVHVADGDIATAVCVLREAVVSAGRRGDSVGEALALHTIARLGHPKEAVDRLSELESVMEGRLIRARSRHVRALVDDDPDELSQAAEAFEAMGAHLLAAEAAADATVAWRRVGRPRRTAAADAYAAVLAARVPTVRTPALRSSAARAALTPTELEVGLLAAAGRSNRQIADELSVSVRTVENHLQRTYVKLGISTRSLLAEHLDRDRAESGTA
jgi:DNA-binding CsgD family transcriptional regulator